MRKRSENGSAVSVNSPVRAQASGAIRDDIGVDDLMTIIASMMFALRRRPGQASDPRRAVAVLRAGLRACPPGEPSPGFRRTGSVTLSTASQPGSG
jgi:hypothetical protein